MYKKQKRALRKSESDLQSNARAIYKATVSTEVEVSPLKGTNPSVIGLRFLSTEDVPSFEPKQEVTHGGTAAEEVKSSYPDILPECQSIVKELVEKEKWKYVHNRPQ